jgi:hypothetical protein
MKRLLTALIPLTTVVLLLTVCSCGLVDTANHSLRVRNEYSTALTVRVGSLDFGKVSSGSTTDYKSIDPGTYTISGDVTGSLTVKGNGTHKWTMTISSSGSCSIDED